MKIMKNYTTSIMEALFEAYKIPKGVGALSDLTQAYDKYYLLSKKLELKTFIQDTLDYIRLRKRDACSRRLCFFFPQGVNSQMPQAFIVYLSKLNPQILMELLPLIENEIDIDNLSVQAKRLIKSLYTEIQCLFLGASASPELVETIKKPFQEAYQGMVQLQFQDISQPYHTLFLTQHIIDMLHQGRTADYPVSLLYNQHIQRLALYTLEHTEAENIHEELEILAKYTLLQEACRASPNFSESQLMLFKQKLYVLQLSPEQSLATLEMDLLIQIYHCHSFSLQSFLRKEIQNRYEAIQYQQSQRKPSWFALIKNWGGQTLILINQYSLIYLSTTVTAWLGPKLSQTRIVKALNRKMNKGLERLMAKLPISASTTLMPNRMRQWFIIPREETIYYSLGWSIGFSLVYYAGFYSLFRSLLISTTAIHLFPYCQGVEIIDRKAKIIAKPSSIKPEYFIRALNFGVAFLETLYLKSPRYLINFVFGFLGNLASINLSAYLFPDMRQSADPESVLMLYFIAQIGYEIGSGLASLGENAYSYCSGKLALRENLKQAIKIAIEETGNHDIEVTFPEKPYLFKFWWKRKDPINLNWIGHDSTNLKAQCIAEPGSLFNIGELVCEKPEASYKALGR